MSFLHFLLFIVIKRAEPSGDWIIIEMEREKSLTVSFTRTRINDVMISHLKTVLPSFLAFQMNIWELTRSHSGGCNKRSSNQPPADSESILLYYTDLARSMHGLSTYRNTILAKQFWDPITMGSKIIVIRIYLFRLQWKKRVGTDCWYSSFIDWAKRRKKKCSISDAKSTKGRAQTEKTFDTKNVSSFFFNFLPSAPWLFQGVIVFNLI